MQRSNTKTLLRWLGILALLSTLPACSFLLPLIPLLPLPPMVIANKKAEEEAKKQAAIEKEKHDWLLKDRSKNLSEKPQPDTSNLWQDMSAGYQLLPEKPNNEIVQKINRYSRHKKYFNQLGEQAEPYLYHIVQELKRRDMPLEIALLPAIESAFRPSAHSPQNAAGLWQVIPSTGRLLGLKQNTWYDGRRDVLASTDAALDYLATLHDRLDNDWLNAIAAYNCGEGAIKRAIDKNKRQGKSTDFWSLDLPQETQNYVPKLMAFSAIVANPETYGVKLPRIKNKPYLEKVDVGGQISLSVAAQLAGMSTGEFRKLNSGHKSWATAPNGPHILLIPKHSASQFKQQLSLLPDAARLPEGDRHTFSPSEPTQQQVKRKKQDKPHYHIVRRGDTLGEIADRYQISIKHIAQLNDIKHKKHLKAGQKIKISAKDGKRKKSAKPLATKTYTVRQGDTLYNIANRFSISVKDLRRANGLKQRNKLSLNKKLSIPKKQ